MDRKYLGTCVVTNKAKSLCYSMMATGYLRSAVCHVRRAVTATAIFELGHD
jgi:hypothetical protein